MLGRYLIERLYPMATGFTGGRGSFAVGIGTGGAPGCVVHQVILLFTYSAVYLTVKPLDFYEEPMIHEPLKVCILSALLIACASCIEAQSQMPRQLSKVEGWPAIDQESIFQAPTAIAVDSQNRVFVYHRAGRPRVEPLPREGIPEDTIFVLDGETGELLSSWGANQFVMPHGLKVDADDNVWVTDVGSHQIHKFSNDGKLLMTFGEFFVAAEDHTHFGEPADLAFYNDHIFVADGYTNTRVVVLDLEGNYQYEWGGAGTAPGQFNLPHGINIDSDGRVYVADRNNSRLQIFTASGEFLAELPRDIAGRPLAVDVTESGEILVLDGGDQPDNTRARILRFTQAGDLIDSIDASSAGAAPLGHDIDVAPDGSIYIADAWAHRISKYVIE